MTGFADALAASSDPDSAVLSTYDSRNEWSGRIRSAYAVVSSMKLQKLATYGIFSIVSFTRHAVGDEWTGFASSTSNSFAFANPTAIAVGVALAPPGVKNRPPGWSRLPRATFSALTASAVNIAFVCASAGPPTIATAG